MALDQIDVLRLPAGLLVSRSESAKLTFRAGRQKFALDVVGKADASDHGIDAIFVADSIVKSFQDEHAGAFTDDQTIGARIKRSASAARRQGTELREAHLGVQAIGPRQTAGQHGVGPAGLQFIHRELESIKGGSTGGIQRIMAAAKAQGLGQDCGG